MKALAETKAASLPPLPAIGSAIVQLLGPSPETGPLEFVQNGGFEQVNDPASQYPWPDYWEGYPDDVGMYAADAIAGSGASGSYIASIYYSTSWGYRQLIQGLSVAPINLTPGKRYILSGKAGRLQGTNRGRLWVQDPNAGYAEFAVIEFDNNFPMVRREIEFVAPPGGRVQVAMDLAPEENLATWHFDDISIRPKPLHEWRDVTPQSMNAQISWGTDDNAGALSLTSAGSWSIVTYDPERLLDPANELSEFLPYLVPGGLVRLVYRREGLPDEQVRLGFIDEIEFDLASKQGTIRATDAISLLVKAKLPDGLEHDITAPTSLRARAAWVLQKAQAEYIEVEGASEDMLAGTGSFEDPALPGWTGLGVSLAEPSAIDGTNVLYIQGNDVANYPKSTSDLIPVLPGQILQLVASGAIAHGSGFGGFIRVDGFKDGVAVPSYSWGYRFTQGGVKVWVTVQLDSIVPTDGSVNQVAILCFIEGSAVPAGMGWMFDAVQLRGYDWDPVVGPPLNGIASAWQHITAAAFDALHAVWLDRNGVLRFRYFGKPRSVDVRFGAGIGGMEIETIDTKLSMENVYNHFKAQNDRIFTLPFNHVEAKHQESIDVYGDLLLERGHRNPDAKQWVDQLLRDRGSASTQYGIATIRPQTPEHLMQLLDLGMMDEIWLYADKHGSIVNKILNVLGGRFEANTDTGWSAGIVTYIPANPWMPSVQIAQQRCVTNLGREVWTNYNQTQANGRSDIATQEVRVSPMAVDGDERHAILMGFPTPDWTNISRIVDVVLQMYRPYHEDNIKEGYAWFNARRIIEPWDETAVWPGPATTVDGENYASCESVIPIWFEIQVLNIVRAWAPVELGGIGAPNYGIKLEPRGEIESPQQHVVISTKLSEDKPYLMLTLEAGTPPAALEEPPPRPKL